MRTTINKSWDFFRVLRLILGLAAVIQGYMENELMLIIAGGLIAAMAIFNVGCCGVTGCSIPQPAKKENNPKKVIYEEVVK